MGAATPGTDDRSASVKAAVLASARALFMRQGFDETGIREIAADAGVNPAIVIRHFGSKEHLFLASVDSASAWKTLLSGPFEDLGVRVVAAVVAARNDAVHTFGTTVRASGRPEVHDRLMTTITKMFVEPLALRLEGPHVELRAHLFAAQLVGLLSAFAVYHDEYLDEVDPQLLVTIYGAQLQALLTPVARVPDGTRR